MRSARSAPLTPHPSLKGYVRLEQVPANLPGDQFHQNLFQFMIFGDPAIQLRY
jgi:hypothetical protein